MMETESTCWTLIRGAAAGVGAAREEFARRYASIVRESLSARWRASPLFQELDDAVQEVFVDCFRTGGALAKAEPGRGTRFRGFLYGVARNVALRFERAAALRRERQPPESGVFEGIAAEEEGFAQTFDRAWARGVMREAAMLQAARAEDDTGGRRKRVELLQMRFRDGLPIREIARRWEADPAFLHHEYARAREEFRSALETVVAFHHPGSPEETRRECEALLGLLE